MMIKKKLFQKNSKKNSRRQVGLFFINQYLILVELITQKYKGDQSQFIEHLKNEVYEETKAKI